MDFDTWDVELTSLKFGELLACGEAGEQRVRNFERRRLRARIEGPQNGETVGEEWRWAPSGLQP